MGYLIPDSCTLPETRYSTPIPGTYYVVSVT
jgi:hypothetical protein